jgi:hypothetical protein
MIEDEINFLREKAAALRDLALRASPIGDTLRRLAEELETRAAQLERNAGGPEPAGEP